MLLLCCDGIICRWLRNECVLMDKEKNPIMHSVKWSNACLNDDELS